MEFFFFIMKTETKMLVHSFISSNIRPKGKFACESYDVSDQASFSDVLSNVCCEISNSLTIPSHQTLSPKVSCWMRLGTETVITSTILMKLFHNAYNFIITHASYIFHMKLFFYNVCIFVNKAPSKNSYVGVTWPTLKMSPTLEVFYIYYCAIFVRNCTIVIRNLHKAI